MEFYVYLRQDLAKAWYMRSVIFPPQSYHRNLSDSATGKGGCHHLLQTKQMKIKEECLPSLFFPHQLLGLLTSDFSSM